jgi:hypothetical protein
LAEILLFKVRNRVVEVLFTGIQEIYIIPIFSTGIFFAAFPGPANQRHLPSIRYPLSLSGEPHSSNRKEVSQSVSA